MSKYFFSLIFCVCQLYSFAQKNSNHNHSSYSKWNIKISPLTLIEPDQAVSIGTEVRITPHIGLQIEGSYIFNTWYISSNRLVTNTQGYRLVPEFRYYDIDFKENLQRYIGVQMSYKQLTKDVEEWVDKSNFQQLETIHINKNNWTAAFIAGIQNHTKMIGFDFNVGLGLKHKSVQNNLNTTNVIIFRNNYGESESGYYPQLSTTIKLCIKIL